MSEVAKWFSNKSIFVTGATGFVGKCLVEKLLRVCPDIVTIYIIIRSKNGVSFEQRKSAYKNHPLFEPLKNTNPSLIDKIQIVEGDVCEPNLGMSMADRKLIAETVSVIFHSAADVRFDRRLIDAYNTNVRGSKWMLDFAREFKNLLAFVLVSTAYSQTIEVGKLEERHYETSIRPEVLQKFVENIDADILDALTPMIIGSHPNTYSFTKGLIEQLVYDCKDKLPMAIARPPIISSAWKEPIPGYTEGIHGVNGWCLATGRGVLRSMICQKDYPCNIMPADVVANGIIVLAHERGTRHEKRIKERNTNKKDSTATKSSEQCDEPLYFNITEENPTSWQTYVDVLKPNYVKCPYDLAIWYPGGSFKQNRVYNFICIALFQILPAILVDMLLVLFRQRPFLLKVQRMISTSCDALEYFMNNRFIFKAFNYNAALDRLNATDKEIFYGRATMNVDQYCYQGSRGSKMYLAKEKLENIPKARALFKRLWFLDVSVKLLLCYWILKKVLSYFDITIY